MFLTALLNQAIATSLAFLLSFNGLFTWPLATTPTMSPNAVNKTTYIATNTDLPYHNSTQIERDEYLQAMIAIIAADGVLSADEMIRLYELFNTYKTSQEKRINTIIDISSDTKNTII